MPKLFSGLRRDDLLIDVAVLQQLLVSSHIRDFTVVHDDDLVGMHDGGDPLGDDDHCGLVGDLAQTFTNPPVGRIVQG